MNIKIGHLDLEHVETTLFYDRELEFLAKDKDGRLYIGTLLDMGDKVDEWLLYKVNKEDYDRIYESMEHVEWFLHYRNEVMRSALPDFWLLTATYDEILTMEKYTSEQVEAFIEEYGTMKERA